MHAALQSNVHEWGSQKSLKDQLIMLQNTSLLSKVYFHFSNISNKKCCVPWPFLNPHWYFDRILSKKVVNYFETKDKVLIGLEFSLKTFCPFHENSFNICCFLYDGILDDVIASSKSSWKYPAKKSLLFLRIFTGISASLIIFSFSAMEKKN